jgi:4-hydroxy-tetrahydrodipicolinate reductase
MGQAVMREAEGRGHQIVAAIGGAGNRTLERLSVDGLAGAEVAIEFTTPAAAPLVVRRLIETGVPVVSGTTGWADGLAELGTLVADRSGSLLHATNFSVGAHLMFRAARLLGSALARRDELDAVIFERHHRRKLDSPSGTALTLQGYLRKADPSRPYPITSDRVGANPGMHVLIIDGPHEELTVSHSVRDRSVFAAGAVLAAEWLPGRTGVFGFESVLFGDER